MSVERGGQRPREVSWYRLELGDALLAQMQVAEIGRQAQEAFEAAGRPVGWAVYLSHASGDLHCRAEVFLSPAAVDLARRLGAEPCAAPPQALSLLAGDEPPKA